VRRVDQNKPNGHDTSLWCCTTQACHGLRQRVIGLGKGKQLSTGNLGRCIACLRQSKCQGPSAHWHHSTARGVSRSWLWTAMNYMSTAEHYSWWRQLCVHAQICVQGSAATAGLLCMLGAVIIFTARAVSPRYRPGTLSWAVIVTPHHAAAMQPLIWHCST
jgi:hypothetical protein